MREEGRAGRFESFTLPSSLPNSSLYYAPRENRTPVHLAVGDLLHPHAGAAGLGPPAQCSLAAKSPGIQPRLPPDLDAAKLTRSVQNDVVEPPEPNPTQGTELRTPVPTFPA